MLLRLEICYDTSLCQHLRVTGYKQMVITTTSLLSKKNTKRFCCDWSIFFQSQQSMYYMNTISDNPLSDLKKNQTKH